MSQKRPHTIEFIITTVAIYERQRRMDSWNYTFAAAVALDQVTFEPVVKPARSDDG